MASAMGTAQTYSIELPTVTASTILERLGDELGQIDQALSTFAAALPQDGKRSLPLRWSDSSA